jgi:hypothetical protein
VPEIVDKIRAIMVASSLSLGAGATGGVAVVVVVAGQVPLDAISDNAAQVAVWSGAGELVRNRHSCVLVRGRKCVGNLAIEFLIGRNNAPGDGGRNVESRCSDGGGSGECRHNDWEGAGTGDSPSGTRRWCTERSSSDRSSWLEIVRQNATGEQTLVVEKTHVGAETVVDGHRHAMTLCIGQLSRRGLEWLWVDSGRSIYPHWAVAHDDAYRDERDRLGRDGRKGHAKGLEDVTEVEVGLCRSCKVRSGYVAEEECGSTHEGLAIPVHHVGYIEARVGGCNEVRRGEESATT